MSNLALVMPMAGRGSRFVRQGVATPKPLIDLAGRPFFWWAVESVRRHCPLRELVFVVLAEHVADHCIDRIIADHYPDARLVVLDVPTAGAAETAAAGIAALSGEGPVAINDCDHAFVAPDLAKLVGALQRGAAGGLVGFASSDPAYSYAQFADDARGRITGTVEKRVVGPYALTGCYLFGSIATFQAALDSYRTTCSYAELFVSGLYNILCDAGAEVAFAPLARHFAFGTPEELARTDIAALQAAFA